MSPTGHAHLRRKVIAGAALFLALSGGVAWASNPGRANTISSIDIINGEVKAPDIGTAEVRTAEIAAGEVKAGDIANAAVTAAKLAPNAVNGAKVLDNALTGADVAEGTLFNDNSLTGADIDESTLSAVPSTPSGPAGGDLAGTYPDPQIANAAVTIPKLAFDPATQAEVDDLATDDGDPPNAGSNQLHWNRLGGVPAGFADGTDDTGGGGWLLGGNAGTNPATDFLGTTDDQPLNLRANDARALRLEPASDGTNPSPNVIGGSPDNSVTTGAFSATIGGGGRGAPSLPETANRVTDHEGTVSGGADNQAGNGGAPNDRTRATVGGGVGNTASGQAATVGGGDDNAASGPGASVGGGGSNSASELAATVGGGIQNTASGANATVAGGSGNQATQADATVAGGNDNRATNLRATVGGGLSNQATGLRATVAGGQSNGASGTDATIGGGANSFATGISATVPGGSGNEARGDYSLAAGRRAQAQAAHPGAFVWADSSNLLFSSTAANQFSVRATGGTRLVSGINGFGNITSGLEIPAGTNALSTLGDQPFEVRVGGARALRIEPGFFGPSQFANMIGGSADNSVSFGVQSATIAGGGRGVLDNPATANRVTDHQGTVSGGANNQAGDSAGGPDDRTLATVGGGGNNQATGAAATVSGGQNNSATGLAATVPGGDSNFAGGDHSYAAGTFARATHPGAFVWADSSEIPGAFNFFGSTAPDQFSVRSTGGVRFVSDIDDLGNPTAGVELAPGGGSWSSLSDAASKRAVEPVSGREVLEGLASIPISTWSYRSQDESIRHIGPMAQDFYRAFGVGEDRRHISSVDADGVALAAIKGLSQKVDRLERKLAALRQEGAE